jgi:phosphatidylserine/phosphatidylglycerophosphate/cardiolipin synthase-like enzyme
VHCHNKMVLVDGNGVVISSQNWSNAAVSENREAGLLLEHKRGRDYFGAIFESDWSTPRKDPGGDQPEVLARESLRTGAFLRVMAGDYAEV